MLTNMVTGFNKIKYMVLWTWIQPQSSDRQIVLRYLNLTNGFILHCHGTTVRLFGNEKNPRLGGTSIQVMGVGWTQWKYQNLVGVAVVLATLFLASFPKTFKTPLDYSKGDHHFTLKPFKAQYQHTHSPHCSLCIFCTSCKNLMKHQGTSSLAILSFILMTCLFQQVVTL